MTRKGRPGAGVGSPPRPSKLHNHSNETYNRNKNQGLKVGSQSAAEREFVAKVMSKLPGLPEPSILVLLNIPKHPVEQDAQRLANEQGEPVAICDMTGKLLAYRMPQQ